MKKIAYAFIALWISGSSLFAVSINQSFVMNSLTDNKLFMDFINVHVTNYATEEYLALYERAAEANFDAEAYYLSGDYRKSFEAILTSQKNLRELYYKLLTERYEKDAEELLKMSTTLILVAKDKTAELSLKKGYSNLATGIYKRKYGFGVSKHMLSQKIRIYMDAINFIIRAKRYALIALIESTTPLIDKRDFHKQTFDEARQNIEILKISDYEFLRNEFINNINKKALPEGYPFVLHHDDNYGQISSGEKSALNRIADRINERVRKQKVEDQPSSGENAPATDNKNNP